MKRITIVLVVLIASVLAYAGGPSYVGQVKIFMKQAGHSQAKIDSVLILPTLPSGQYLYVSDDYLSAAVVTINEDGSGVADPLYKLESGK